MMHWDTEAEEQLKKAPVFVRKLARAKIEQSVRDQGRDRVTLPDYQAAYARFRKAFGSKGEAAAKDMAPATKEDRPSMVLVDTCSGEIRNCRHLLIPVSQWAERLEQTLEDIQFSDRLLQRVEGDTVLFHHKFKVSVSGCPNCCSQPQIKDFGAHGQSRPQYLDGCIQCNLCVEACPDDCITLTGYPEIDYSRCSSCGDCIKVCPVDECLVPSNEGARLLMGGKLGRHPHLADQVADYASIDQACSSLRQMAEAYISTSQPEERVADWVARTSFQPHIG